MRVTDLRAGLGLSEKRGSESGDETEPGRTKSAVNSVSWVTMKERGLSVQRSFQRWKRNPWRGAAARVTEEPSG